jgi:uncharacterized membrane protein SpoIIM required for sporulation
MGIRIFNREEILSKEMDELHLKKMWRDFKGYFLRPPELATYRADLPEARFSLARIYRHDIPLLLKDQRLPLGIVLLTTVVALVVGSLLAQRYPIPPEVFPLENVSPESFENIQRVQFLPRIATVPIFVNNVRVLILAAFVSVFTFGALTLTLTLVNMGVVGFIVAQVINMGYNPWLFILAFILPHGILEIPAILIGMAFALRIGASLISPPQGLDIGQALLLTGANFVKILIFLIAPVLLLAAFIEANLTPQLVLAFYGGG